MDEYIGVVKLFAGNFAPKGWMFCDGRLLSIANNNALFSILGTTYGGDGRTTFALPNLKGRMPVGAGSVASSGNYLLGAASGTTQNTLLATNLPSVDTGFQLKVANRSNSSTSTATTSAAITETQAETESSAVFGLVNDSNPDTVINSQSISFAGQNSPINNMSPYLVLNYIICVEGIYPVRD